MTEQLNTRLGKGPLPVGSLFSPERAASVSLRALRRRRRRLVLAALTVSACLLLFASLRGGGRVTTAHTNAPTPASVRLADGSTVELHGASSTLLTEEIAAQRVSLRLSGGARFDVVPNPARSFEVVSREVTVRVLGTAFSLDPEGGRTRVAVERGRVEVSWKGGHAILSAGEAGLFPPELASPAPREPMGETSLREAEQRAVAAEPARGTRTRATARAAQQTASELMLAADLARLSAHPERAVALLGELARRFPRDKRAPVAAFTLGRVLLDELGRSAEAAAAFERADALWPTGPLAESALARAVEAHQRAGNGARARVLAEQYLARFARGKHAQAMRSSFGL